MLVTSEPHRKAAVKNGRRRGVKKKNPVDGTEVIPDARSLIPQLCVKAVGVCVCCTNTAEVGCVFIWARRAKYLAAGWLALRGGRHRETQIQVLCCDRGCDERRETLRQRKSRAVWYAPTLGM